MVEETEGLMSLPRATLLEIVRREKKNSFMIGNPVPFGVMLKKLLARMKITTADLCKITGVTPEFIQLVIQDDKHACYPYDQLLKKHPEELLMFMQALRFTIFDWQMAPDPRYYHYQPVAMADDDETMEELEEVREKYDKEKDPFVKELHLLIKARGISELLQL